MTKHDSPGAQRGMKGSIVLTGRLAERQRHLKAVILSVELVRGRGRGALTFSSLYGSRGALRVCVRPAWEAEESCLCLKSWSFESRGA